MRFAPTGMPDFSFLSRAAFLLHSDTIKRILLQNGTAFIKVKYMCFLV